MTKVKKMKIHLIVILIMIAASISILATFDNVIESIKHSRCQAIEQSKERDFESIWAYIQVLRSNSNIETTELVNKIESQIDSEFDLDQLKVALDNNDNATRERLYEIFRDNINGVYLDDNVKNNRNSMIVLEGYDTIIEDKLVEPITREDNDPSSKAVRQFGEYYDKSYNKPLFKSAVAKLRSHSTSQLIAIEPFNYLSGEEEKNHTMIKDMTYSNLKKVYINEGIDALKNYQFLVPIYITDTGDIFGDTDIVGGVLQNNHKFIVIQTFNVYDQLMNIVPKFDDSTYINNINEQYNTILNMLYLCGLIVCITIVIMILYFFSVYNAICSINAELINVLSGKDRRTNRDS